ncbi:MAG: glycosyltransferase family 4 protein [Proteobacteria bacterium]|nr:glycosyltransferase family 4 protein [Pseudomonadota bacterium]
MKILNINKYYQHTSGGDRFFFDTENILSSLGHEVIPYCLDYRNNYETPFSKYFPEGIPGTDTNNQPVLKKVKLFLNGIYSFEAKNGLAHLISESSPEIAHLHILHYTLSPSVIDILHSKGIPIVFSLHDYRIFCAGAYLYRQGHQCQKCINGHYYNAIKYRCDGNSIGRNIMATIGNYIYKFTDVYDKVDLFTVPHDGMMELMAQAGIPRKKIRVLKNPFSVNEELPLPSLGEQVTFFGYLSFHKGILTLLKAAANLPNIPFIICGKGEALNEIQAFIERNKIKNVEIDTVSRWHNGLKNILASSRFVVSPSEWPTPLEYSTLETMSLGKAIVASRIGGNAHIIKDGETGIFFEPGNSGDLERAINYLYSRPELCEQIGKNARNEIIQNFSEDAFYQELINIYDEAIDLRRNQI